jgi:uncharacterized protein (UPF0303 family)
LIVAVVGEILLSLERAQLPRSGQRLQCASPIDKRLGTSMDMDDDLRRIAKQEERLRFKRFDQGAAWELGTRLKALAESRKAQIVIDIRLAREQAFFYAMPGTTTSNADWARRKRNTVEFFHRSSYGVGLAQPQDGEKALERTGLPVRDYADQGGGLSAAGRRAWAASGPSRSPDCRSATITCWWSRSSRRMCGVPAERRRLP